ncbi:MAG: GAF domain-containing protein [Myxococcales bacterium]|nr:GAF domain-containing protein [Myxococcales bacterium]MCB9627750.1 GAF domain-containing protein [Sandaracinaceae bacterium]
MESLTQSRLEEKLEKLELLLRIGTALSAERSKDRLIEMILLEAKALCNADGGTLYLRSDDSLRFAILRSDSLGIALGGSTGKPVDLPPLPLHDPLTGAPNRSNVATCAALMKESVNIPDAYETSTEFDFTGTKAFDARNDYRSQSFLTVPLVNNDSTVIGVLQLLNAQDPDTGEVVPFRADHQRVVESLASQAGIALDNQLLLDGQRELLESFIQMIAAAIDAKSPYTGGHCERVPILTEMLVRAACDDQEGAFRDFTLSDEEWYELRIAAWLHDCGKVTTPVHVMDKATKLETIFDRIAVVRARFAVLERDARITMLEAVAAGAPRAEAEASFHATVQTLRDELAFLENANIGSEFLPDAARARIAEIGARRYQENGQERPLLDADEVYNLQIQRGTLTNEERLVINGHMVQTVKMLERLPFPRNLRRVPEYAGGHHEKMDGGGYPKGIYAGDMSVPARIMAVADVFEALTAQDRPYKKGKTLSEAMRIMAFMKRDNHLDPELFDLFVRSGVYREYGHKYLPAELIDDVDEAALLAVQPKPFPLPPEPERKRRFLEFLPEYMEATVAGELRGPA